MLKNFLSLRLSETLNQAGRALATDDTERAVALLEENRTLLHGLSRELTGLAGDRDILQQVVLAAEPPRDEELAGELAAIGVPRVCRPGTAQSPAAGWPQDGRPPLSDLVSWTEWDR